MHVDCRHSLDCPSAAAVHAGFLRVDFGKIYHVVINGHGPGALPLLLVLVLVLPVYGTGNIIMLPRNA